MSRRLPHPFACVLAVVSVLVAVDDATAQQKAAVPGEEAQLASQKAASELYGGRFRQAKTTADRIALAAEMIDTALNVEDGSADQYVLLRIARDMAAGVGDAPTALRAVEGTAKRFDVAGAKLTAETLQAAARNATTSGQQKAVAEAVVSVVEALADADEYDLVLSLCDLALPFAKNSKQYALAKELTAKIEDFQKRQHAFQEYKAAWALMQDDPAEPASNLTAGRYLCFVKGDWLKGVPMLALGSDAALKNVSLMELRGAKSAEQQAVIGDAWWDVAETKQGSERDLLRLRAGFWYRQAEPNLPAGLERLKVTRRLGEISRPASSARLVAAPPTADKPEPKPPRQTKNGYPAIAGQWLEANSISVVILQNNGQFTAEAVYQHHTAGQIRWQCSGTISKDGRIEATLIHTQAPSTWEKLQARVAQLAPDGNTIQGQSMVKNTTHAFTWTRSNRPQTSAGAK